MRPTSYQSEDLDRLLRKHKIATLDDLKAVLGTDVDSTVFRKLNELAYRTSYSHRGSYYTLDEIAQFDRKGLWSLRSVWFSKYGTLLATVKALVAACEAGYYVDELEDVVQVDVKAPLLKLVREKRLAREQVFGRYLYLATDVSTRKQQLSARQVRGVTFHVGLGRGSPRAPRGVEGCAFFSTACSMKSSAVSTRESRP